MEIIILKILNIFVFIKERWIPQILDEVKDLESMKNLVEMGEI